MSDQCVTQLSLSVESTNFSDNKNWEYTQALIKQGFDGGFQDLTSDWEAVTFSDVVSTDYGTLILVNLNASNTIIWGSTPIGEFRLLPTDFAKVGMNPGTTTLSAKTLAGSAKLQKYLLAE